MLGRAGRRGGLHVPFADGHPARTASEKWAKVEPMLRIFGARRHLLCCLAALLIFGCFPRLLTDKIAPSVERSAFRRPFLAPADLSVGNAFSSDRQPESLTDEHRSTESRVAGGPAGSGPAPRRPLVPRLRPRYSATWPPWASESCCCTVLRWSGFSPERSSMRLTICTPLTAWPSSSSDSSSWLPCSCSSCRLNSRIAFHPVLVSFTP